MNWRRFFMRGRIDAEQQEELESYIEITAEEYTAQGMSPEEARLAARRKLGNLTRIREEVYEVNTATVVENTMREVRHALRMLRLNPAFSLTATLTLALGIGATTAMFSVVNGVVIKPLPYPNSDFVVTPGIAVFFGDQQTRDFPLTPRILATYRQNGRAFQEFGLFNNTQVAITGLGEAEQVRALQVTYGVLPALGVQPSLGRWFSQEDDQPQAPPTAILTHDYWQRRFGGDANAIGRTMIIDKMPVQVIGVMPASFAPVGAPPDVIFPFRFNLAQPPGEFCCQGIARLRPGVTIAQANADYAQTLAIWRKQENRASLDALRMSAAVRPLKEDVVGNVGNTLWVLLGSIGIVLLIACANVANLLLVRAEGRGQELAVRTALGAGWGHIARALMVESLTLSIAGGLLGLALAYGSLQFLIAHAPANLPRLVEITIDLPVFGFAMATSILSGLLFGLIPVAKVALPRRMGSLEFTRGTARWSSAGKSQHRSQNAMVVLQVALALVLVVSSGLMIRTFQNIRKVDPGFTDPASLQTLRVTILPGQVAESQRVTRVLQDIRNRLAAIPGVQSVAFTNQLPMEPQSNNAIAAAEGIDYGSSGIPPTRRISFISPGYLQTLGTPLLAGRDLTWEELQEQRNVVLVSENFARGSWNTVEGALGKRVKVGTYGPWQVVIGVVADVHDNGADQPAPETVYWPARSHPYVTSEFAPRSIAFAMRSDRTGTETLVREARRAVAEAMPDLPVTLVRPLSEVYEQSMARTAFSLAMIGIAGAMALALGVVGIYGVLAYAVLQRQREVGIRLALGAVPGRVMGMFVYRGLILSCVGIVLGMGAAAGLTRWISSMLFGVAPVDAVTYTAAAGVLIVAALAASYLPARRAAAVDPVETLRGQ